MYKKKRKNTNGQVKKKKKKKIRLTEPVMRSSRRDKSISPKEYILETRGKRALYTTKYPIYTCSRWSFLMQNKKKNSKVIVSHKQNKTTFENHHPLFILFHSCAIASITAVILRKMSAVLEKIRRKIAQFFGCFIFY